jgi:hypothetical protein
VRIEIRSILIQRRLKRQRWGRRLKTGGRGHWARLLFFSDQGREQAFDLAVVGEAVGLALGVDGLAVEGDLKVAGGPDRDVRVEAEFGFEPIRESDRSRFIPSHPAICDVDLVRHEAPPGMKIQLL